MSARAGIVGALVVAGCLIAGCANDGQNGRTASPDPRSDRSVGGTAKPGGALTVAIGGDPDSLDPALAQSAVSGDVLAPMCEGLYRRDADAVPRPQLATAQPTISDGGRTVSVPLRTGVEFNDGTSFNSAAVKRSLELGGQLPGSSFQPILKLMRSIETPDPKTVVFHLTEPYAPLVNQLTYLLIGSPTQRQKLGAKFATEPVCVGPFTFDKRVSGTSISMTKSSRYYGKSAVQLDTIVFKIIGDTNARQAALRTGAAQLATGIPLTDVATLRSASGVRVLSQVGAGWVGLAVNEGNVKGAGQPPARRDTPLAKSLQLREALGLAIDRTALAQVTSNGLSNAGCSPIPPNSPYFDKPQCPPPDVAKAKQLVDASGYPTPIKVEMISYNSLTNSRLSEAIQNMVKRAGFELTISTFDLSTWIDRQYSGKYDLSLAVWLGAGEPSQDVGEFFTRDGSQNYTGFQNSQVDSLLSKAEAENRQEVRAGLYKQALERVRADHAITFLLNPAVALGARDDLVNFSFNPLGNLGIAFAGFRA